MRLPPTEPTASEWQTDEHGKRYRKIGNCIEYEMTIGGIPESQLEEYHRRQKEADEKRRAAEQAEAARLAALRRHCPFKDTNSFNTDCDREKCALFIGESCTLARLTPATDTAGKQCPFNLYRHACRKDCALYKGGCTLTGIKESEDK